MNSTPLISLIVTVFNEEQNVTPLIKAIRTQLQGLDYEVLFVDDGSKDQTVNQIKLHATPRIKLVRLQRNYGQALAMAAGIQEAKGNYIVTMDGDLQNDPADIPTLLHTLVEGNYDLVTGFRKERQDHFWLRKFPSRLANMLIRFLSGVYIRDYGCSLKIFRADIAREMGLYGELHRFIPILVHLQGGRIAEIPVNHHARKFGVSKYGFGRVFKVISDLMLLLFFQKYSQKPMHLFGMLGLTGIFLGGAINGYLLVQKILGYDIWGRPLLILGTLLLLGGIQLVTFGFIMEMMMRTYYESQGKTPFRIKEIYTGRANEEMVAEYY